MKRKTIAICVTSYDYEYESMVVQGVRKRCEELDINLLCFAPMTKKLSLNIHDVLSDNVIKGESEIFNLINYDIVDGILLMGDSFINKDCIFMIDKKAKEHGVPVININDTERLLDVNVLLSDKIAMGFTVEHLIKEHGKKRIGFIGGFPGNLQTEERLEAYRSVLEENGIPFDEELVTYGEFWTKAYECTEQLMSLENKPDAIACASDSMSFFCMDKLKELGYRVPEDVSVTGFDGIVDGEMYSPRVTTVKRDHEKAGIVSVDIMTDMWSGNDVPKITYVDSKLIVRQSCGCHEYVDTSSDFYSKHYATINHFKEFNAYSTYSNAIFSGSKTSSELYTVMCKGADFFGFNRMYICVSPQFELSELNMIQNIDTYVGMPDTMLSVVEYGHKVPPFTEFETKKIFPEDVLNEDKAVFFAFSPFYFKNRFLGYFAFEPTAIEGQGELFGIWLMNFSHNAGSFYMNRALELLYVKDALTGLYNRHGLEKLGPSLFEKAKQEHSSFTVICSDIDRLKPINDTYGHEGGDNAIFRTANAIITAMPKDSICVRTGGDEFCILAEGITAEQTEKYIAKVYSLLDEYNSTSGLPYTVGCSCGYMTVNADDVDSIADVMNKADEKMYDFKQRKKAMREKGE